jgi:hydroxymethylbilane synthase
VPGAVIRLGTRGSALALAQARWVAERLNGEVELVPITTSGDQRRGSAPGAQPSGKGLTPFGGFVTDKARFVKEIDEALLAGDIDLAVHSAKDVPAELPRGLVIQAVPERADPRDAVCGVPSLEALPEGAVVGTASLRRRALLLSLRPDLDVRDLRGNVDTRLRRLAEGDFDAIVLAQAGLDRLGRGEEGNPIDPGDFVPAPGQGCLMIEARDADEAAIEACAGLTDITATERLLLERTVVRRLGATCHTPIGVYATGALPDEFTLTAFIGLPDGSTWIRDELRSPDDTVSDALGLWVADRLLAAGAEELLAEAERAAVG